MAEIAAGTIGAVGSLVAAIHTSVSGFSGRHDFNLDAQLAETQRFAEAFDKAYQEGNVDEGDYEKFQRKKEEAIASGNEYFEAIDEFKKTSAINIPQKNKQKREVRNKKRKLREANRSLRNHFYDSGYSSDASSITATSGSPPDSRLRDHDIFNWASSVEEDYWRNKADDIANMQCGSCETLSLSSSETKTHDYIEVQAAFKAKAGSSIFLSVPRHITYSDLRLQVAKVWELEHLLPSVKISLDHAWAQYHPLPDDQVPPQNIDSDFAWKVITKGLKVIPHTISIDVAIGDDPWFFVRVFSGESDDSVTFSIKRTDGDTDLRNKLAGSTLSVSHPEYPGHFHSLTTIFQERVGPQNTLEVLPMTEWHKIATAFNGIVLRLHLNVNSLYHAPLSEPFEVTTVWVDEYNANEQRIRRWAHRSISFYRLRGLVYQDHGGNLPPGFRLYLKAPKSVPGGADVLLGNDLWTELLQDYEGEPLELAILPAPNDIEAQSISSTRQLSRPSSSKSHPSFSEFTEYESDASDNEEAKLLLGLRRKSTHRQYQWPGAGDIRPSTLHQRSTRS